MTLNSLCCSQRVQVHLTPCARKAILKAAASLSLLGLVGDEEQPGAHWLLITSTMVAEMLGIGALSLPSAFARLGWGGAAAVLVLAGSGMAFSGVLFAKLGVHVPKARVCALRVLVAWFLLAADCLTLHTCAADI